MHSGLVVAVDFGHDSGGLILYLYWVKLGRYIVIKVQQLNFTQGMGGASILKTYPRLYQCLQTFDKFSLVARRVFNLRSNDK